MLTLWLLLCRNGKIRSTRIMLLLCKNSMFRRTFRCTIMLTVWLMRTGCNIRLVFMLFKCLRIVVVKLCNGLTWVTVGRLLLFMVLLVCRILRFTVRNIHLTWVTKPLLVSRSTMLIRRCGSNRCRAVSRNRRPRYRMLMVRLILLLLCNRLVYVFDHRLLASR